MGIAGWFATLFISFLLYNAYKTSLKPVIPSIPEFLVAQQVGKSRNTGGSKRDASMFTEFSRRRAVLSGVLGSPCRIHRESTYTKGFSTGPMDMFLTGIGEVAKKVCATMLDGGDAENGGRDPLDGNGRDGDRVIDGGDANTEACANCHADYDGGNVNTESAVVADGSGDYTLDGGTANTNLWW